MTLYYFDLFSSDQALSDAQDEAAPLDFSDIEHVNRALAATKPTKPTDPDIAVTIGLTRDEATELNAHLGASTSDPLSVAWRLSDMLDDEGFEPTEAQEDAAAALIVGTSLPGN